MIFSEKGVAMPGMMEEALRILKTTRKKEITQTELLRRVATRTGRPVDTVRGTVIGWRSDKLMGKPEIVRAWVYCRNPTRFVQKRYAKDAYQPSYDTPEKKKARLRSFAEFLKIDKPAPRVLTLGADSGYCVRQILSVAPMAEVVNVEKDPDVLARYEALDFPTTNYLGALEDFVAEDGLEFDFLNLDLMGYMSRERYRMFAKINAKTTAQTIAVNLQYGQRFRNYGRWVDWAKRRFRNRDQIRQAMNAAFSAYELRDCFQYTRDKTCQCRPMRVFVFRR
jgi:hypothetical protein